MRTLTLMLILPMVTQARNVDVTDRPTGEQYERNAGFYCGKYSLGDTFRISPRECALMCNDTPRCMGFNYFVTRKRCEMTTHNKYTNPSAKRYRSSNNIDHYVKLDANYVCPEAAFRHPYKPRCYQLFYRPKSWKNAMKECRGLQGQLAIIPNQMTRDSLWPTIKNRIQDSTIWLGLELRTQAAFLRRGGQKSSFMWFSNLLRGLPEGFRGFQCGAGIISSDQNDGKFDYYPCQTEMPFLCEIRPHRDTEINEICPSDTALFDGNCFWSEEGNMEAIGASDLCAERGGRLATFPSDESIRFIASIWRHIVAPSVTESWIGLKHGPRGWLWEDGDPDLHPRLWSSITEKREGETESCATARMRNDDLHWLSHDCNEPRPFLCMGPSRVVMSVECENRTCPRNSVCREGPFESTCDCVAGYVPTYSQGVLHCQSSSVCQAQGDPHYSIWDGGHRVHYQGLCLHLLAGTCRGPPAGYPAWQVMVYNTRRQGWIDSVSWTEYIEVHVYGVVVRMGLDMELLINGESRTPEFVLYPYDDDRVIKIIPKATGNTMKLYTDFGLRVDYKNYRATVEAPEDYANHMCGICGNYNGDPADDVRHDQDRWLQSPDSENPACIMVNPYVNPTCDEDVEDYAQRRCGLIHTLSVFDTCRQAQGVELSPFFDDCVTDACGGNLDQVDIIVCNTLEAASLMCAGHGYEPSVVYRYQAECEMECPPHSTYSPEMSLDIPTCQNPDALYVQTTGTSEGCACDTGYIRDGGVCCPIDDCGCLYGDEEIYLPLGGTYVNENCSTLVTCKENGNAEETDIECGENARCVLNEEGEHACECKPDHVGNPLQKCNHKDACPYPMPGDPDFGFGTNSLKVNDGGDNIVLIEPGTTILNSRCRTITCHLTDNWSEGDIACVPHAHCERGEGVYQCVCDRGYTGNGTVECDDDTSGTGDPHFMITSHKTGDHLCFDAHGYQDDIWKLVEDMEAGIVVNGKLFETADSTAERPQSYFSQLTILFDDQILLFGQEKIYTGNSTNITWGENVHFGVLHYVAEDLYEVRVHDNVTIRISRAYSDTIGYYLGIYIVNSDGLSAHAHGLIGQFIKTTFKVEDIRKTDDGEIGTIIFDDNHPSVTADMTSRYNRVHQGKIDCWLYKTTYGNDQMLGNREVYTVNSLLEL